MDTVAQKAPPARGRPIPSPPPRLTVRIAAREAAPSDQTAASPTVTVTLTMAQADVLRRAAQYCLDLLPPAIGHARIGTLYGAEGVLGAAIAGRI